MVQRDKGITAVEGIIADQDGIPVENAVVFAYLSSKAAGRPTFVSERTDKKGRYQIRFHAGGTYYLRVRSVIGGGTPEAGEFLNTTSDFNPEQVTITTAQTLHGITLKVKKFTRSGSSGPNERTRKESAAPAK